MGKMGFDAAFSPHPNPLSLSMLLPRNRFVGRIRRSASAIQMPDAMSRLIMPTFDALCRPDKVFTQP